MVKESITYQQQAYDYVREQIINLGLKPGEFITDKQIAEQLNISRTPVREAFQRLEKEGLLLNEARKGWQVYSLTLADIYEIFELKSAIEGMVVRKAVDCKDETLREELSAALDYMKQAAEANDREEWLQADIHLHNTLFLMGDNVRAERFIANLNDQWHRLRLGYDAMQGRTARSIKEHEAFVKSVLAGDADSAEQYMRTHLERVRDDLVNLVTKVLLPYTGRGF
jgi:DNA-binding GntR family transcriptional regulator